MTLDSTTSRVQYTQAGATTEWPVTFKFLDNGDLIVITTASGVDTTLVLDTDYTVAGAGDDAGGTVTISPAVAAGTLVTIYREIDLDQPTELTTAGGWFPKVHEAVFDRLTMQIQQVQEEVGRAVKTGITSTETPDNIMADLYAARDAAATSASDASDFADAAAASASDASGFADTAQGHANTAAGYVTDAEGFADDAEQAALDAEAVVASAAFSNMPIGMFHWHTGTTPPAGSIVADGEERSRAAFPDLWVYAQASGNISVDDASWTFGQYSPGDGSTTFRVPKLDDRFVRGKSGSRAVGLVEEDAFQGHIHEYEYRPAISNDVMSDITYAPSSDADGASSGQTNPDTNVNLNYIGEPSSDGTNGTPRTADETRPKALTMLPCIKAYDVISDSAELNAAAIVSEVARLESDKLDKDENINLGVSVAASGTAVDFVGIPEGVKRITVMFDGVSTNGILPIIVQLGTPDGIEANGYISGGTAGGNQYSSPIGFAIQIVLAADSLMLPMTIQKIVDNSYVASYAGWRPGVNVGVHGGGSKTLAGPLDRIRITAVNGTDQFDAGTINISWEF